MAKMSFLLAILWAICVVIPGGDGTLVFGQSDTGTAPTHTKELNEQEIRGEGVFLQHCSLCHLPLKEKGRTTRYGPPLGGVFKDVDPDQEKDLREIILKGTDRMPGWQYLLEKKDLDDLVAYLRTL